MCKVHLHCEKLWKWLVFLVFRTRYNQCDKYVRTNVKVHIFCEGQKNCKISSLLLTGTTEDKSKAEISQNFVAFSEYMNFK